MVAFATGWIVIHGRGNPWLRAVIVFLLTVSTVGLLERMNRFRGTPRPGVLQCETLIHGFLVDEATGKIYLYCGGKPPESLVVEYEREAHKALEQGREKFQGKSFVLVKGKGEPGDGRPGEGEPGDGGPGGDLSTKSETDYSVKFPEPLLPEK